ncbi:WcaI family glycosyltransferase [Tsukamurella sp. 8F]|uniref:WcaI family glycosyltransferase n=1 Tax=unclassified Tsukamurella TaxID=2633480 RepID=UPI0023B97DE7|nr:MULTISPECIES: WcaI family glycosyltransferase [unclassified Tsukamurella]MDF0532148.1 WcaI family glycosyltransferase [Tsukamurella sp. 8J]MDF0589432.1 WcaI family glycosyltransferase [Tsukamurella sp. 8F]
MRITIVGINYAPEPTGIAPYTAGTARGLAARGHAVTVVTGVPHYPDWRVSEEYRGVRRRTESDGAVRLQRVGLYVPDGVTTARRVRMEAGFAARATVCGWGRPEVVLVISPALLSAAAVVERARCMRVPVGVVVQDLYGPGVVETGVATGRAAQAVATIERRVLSRADAVSVIHDRFRDQVAALGARRVRTIRNWTHVAASAEPTAAERSAMRRRHGWSDGETVVLHAGNMGLKQGLESVVDAARLVGSDDRIRFVLLGDGNRRRVLEEAGRDVGALQFLRPVDDDEFPVILAAADVLLINERPEVGDMALPSKLTSYAAAGRPVLAATRVDSVTAHEIRSAGLGSVIAPGDPALLARSAAELAADPARVDAFGAAGRRYAREVLAEAVAIDHYEDWCVELTAGRRR